MPRDNELRHYLGGLSRTQYQGPPVQARRTTARRGMRGLGAISSDAQNFSIFLRDAGTRSYNFRLAAERAATPAAARAAADAALALQNEVALQGAGATSRAMSSPSSAEDVAFINAEKLAVLPMMNAHVAAAVAAADAKGGVVVSRTPAQKALDEAVAAYPAIVTAQSALTGASSVSASEAAFQTVSAAVAVVQGAAQRAAVAAVASGAAIDMQAAQSANATAGAASAVLVAATQILDGRKAAALAPVDPLQGKPVVGTVALFADISARAAAVAAENPTVKAARYTRGILTAQLNDFVTVCETTLAHDIYNPGKIFTADTGVYPVLAFEGACTDENLKQIGVRGDLYQRAQIALGQLTAPGVAPDQWPFDLAPKATLRDECAKVAADWLTAVYNWVSLAFYSANVQPHMLFPAYTSQVGDGEYKCTRQNPDPVQQVIQNITMMGDAAGAELMTNNRLGPSWMGYYDKAPTGWLTGNFGPQHSESFDIAMKYSAKSDIKAYPTDVRKNAPPSTDAVSGEKISKDTIIDPWFYWYYGLVSATDWSGYTQRYTWIDTTGVDDKKAGYATGPKAFFAFANAWAEVVRTRSCFDILGPSYDWYANNHMNYWMKLGLIDYTIGDIDQFQRASAAGVAQAKGAAATGVINSVGGALMAVPNPIAQGVGAGIALLGSLITMGVTKRRAKRRANASKKPDPLTLRTMTDVACATFGTGLTIPQGLANAAVMLAAGDSASARASAADPTGSGNLNASGGSAAISTVQNTSLSSDPTGTTTVQGQNLAPGASSAPLQPAPGLVSAIADAQSGLPTAAALPQTLSQRAQSISTPVWIGVGVLSAALLYRLLAPKSS